MVKISIFGQGNMGNAIGEIFENSGQNISYIGSNDEKKELGEVIVFAVMYPVVETIIDKYAHELENKLIIDITNPVNFENFDGLVVPDGSSAAEIIAEKLPSSQIIKAFNTNFAASLITRKVANSVTTTILVAGDEEAKDEFFKLFNDEDLKIIHVGRLKYARYLEAMGFLQISLAINEQISWTGGFGIFE